MKAIRVTEFGGPEVLKVADVPALTADTGQVVVEIKAVGVNPVDGYIRSGQYADLPALPYTPGIDASGTVKAVGPGVTEFVVDDSVFVVGSLTGTYAQECLCRADQVFPLPPYVNFEQGAGLGIPYATAYRALFSKAKAVPRETVFVHGASGGVGIAAVQWARSAGLKIIATAGSAGGLELLKKEHVDHCLDHSRPGYLAQVQEITGGKGVDIILEMRADVNLGEDLKVTGKNGRIVVVGCRGTVMINPRDAMTRDITIHGMLLMNALSAERLEIYTAVQEGIVAGYLRPVVATRYSLAEAAYSHRDLTQKSKNGKIVLLP